MSKKFKKIDPEVRKNTILRIERKEIGVMDAARELGISPHTITKWMSRWRDGNFIERPSAREKALEKEVEKLKTTVGGLYHYIEQLKKTAESKQRMKNANTSVITADNLSQFVKRVK